MKYLLPALLAIILPLQAWANSSTCFSIKDQDRKNHCLALAKDQVSYCHSIRESDLKNFCQAQVKEQKSYCHSIRSSDTRNQCLGMLK